MFSRPKGAYKDSGNTKKRQQHTEISGESKETAHQKHDQAGPNDERSKASCDIVEMQEEQLEGDRTDDGPTDLFQDEGEQEQSQQPSKVRKRRTVAIRKPNNKWENKDSLRQALHNCKGTETGPE
jgi:hypothetical protein